MKSEARASNAWGATDCAVGAHVVDRLAEPVADQFRPHPVDEGFGKPAITAGRHPQGQVGPPLLVARAAGQLLAGGEEDRLHQFALVLGMIQVGHVVFERDFFLRSGRPLLIAAG